MTNKKTFFAPQLFIPSGVSDISFYFKAFGAFEIKTWRNDDSSVHVAELCINRTIFHFSPCRCSKKVFNHMRPTLRRCCVFVRMALLHSNHQQPAHS